jgi:hypothetical protein
MALRSITRIMSEAAEFGAVAIFIAMILVWADVLPIT